MKAETQILRDMVNRYKSTYATNEKRYLEAKAQAETSEQFAESAKEQITRLAEDARCIADSYKRSMDTDRQNLIDAQADLNSALFDELDGK
jgi:hypothetical protein